MRGSEIAKICGDVLQIRLFVLAGHDVAPARLLAAGEEDRHGRRVGPGHALRGPGMLQLRRHRWGGPQERCRRR